VGVRVPSPAQNSRVIQRLHETDLELRMPYEKPALSKEEIELFTRWIDQGAQWGTHWAYIPPVKTRLPEVDSKFKQDNFLLTPIDYFVAARMEDINLFPSRQAESDVLARRAAFDITGLPPDQRLFDLYTTKKLATNTILTAY